MIRVLLLALILPPVTVAAERNIVLVVSDDQSPDFGAYGNDAMKTPNLDRLAESGTLFRYAFCTTASCSASRSVILTGLHNHANGQYGHQHAFHKFSAFDDVVSLPLYLAAVGYRTARCGKYHVAPDAVFRFEHVLRPPPRDPVAMAERCRDLIESDDERPFFLYFCTYDPHRGGGFAEELPGKPDRFGNPKRSEPARDGSAKTTYELDDVVVPPFLPDTPVCRAELAQYYESCARVDRGVGRLVRILQESGRWDDTLVMFVSDHGIAMPGAKTTVYEGGLRSPCLVRDPYVATPVSESSAMVSWVDITPTILDFAGALDDAGRVRSEVLEAAVAARGRPADAQNGRTKPGSFHGRSFLDLLREEPREGWDVVYASHTFHEIQMYYPMRVVRERRYKLIWNIAHPLPFPFASDLWAAPTWQAQWALGRDAPFGRWTVGGYIERPEFELFDLLEDPWEGNNLAGDAAHADTLERLKSELRAFQRRVGDPWVTKWDYE